MRKIIQYTKTNFQKKKKNVYCCEKNLLHNPKAFIESPSANSMKTELTIF